MANISPNTSFKKLPDDEIISAAQGTAYLVVNPGESDSKTYRLYQVISFEAKMATNVVEFKRVGTNVPGRRAVSADGTFSIELYAGTEYFRDALLAWQNTGKMPKMNLLIYNDDPASKRGIRKTRLTNIILDEGTVAKLSASDDWLTESFSGTFETCEVMSGKKFQPVTGDAVK